MNQQLIDKNYLVIPSFISSERAKELAKDFKHYSNTHNLGEDPQVQGCVSKFDHIPFVQLLVEKNTQVGQLVGEQVLPTYSYARIYQKGNVLDGHVDKGECEISLTINLDCDKPWDIWIECPDSTRTHVSLEPGDAMIYLGTIARHGRDAFDGEYCTQLFLHYVNVNGPHKLKYFCKQNKYVEDAIKPPQKEEPPEKTIAFTSTNPLADFIRVYDNILTKEECDSIIKEYYNSDEWTSALVGSGQESTAIRNCDILNVSRPDVIANNQEVRKNIDDLLFKKSFVAAKKYVDEFPTLTLESDSGYDLLRYDVGGFYRQHTDSYKANPRTLSMSINLNDDYIGGEMAFFDREIQIRTAPGSVIVFPSNFMYPHEIIKVIEGVRYSIVTWFI
jgi:predicted 2-oxoglutarate/Fe(II)-dependent dioxygenase YbiX